MLAAARPRTTSHATMTLLRLVRSRIAPAGSMTSTTGSVKAKDATPAGAGRAGRRQHEEGPAEKPDPGA